MQIVPLFKNENRKEHLEKEKVMVLEKAGEIVGANVGGNGKGWCAGGNMGS